MCGIAGYVGRSMPTLLSNMLIRLAHRGPDDSGIHEEPGVGLGMTRLDIIDLAGGHQPIWNEARDIAVILNGEIYNYRELRDTLERCGHRFATRSDTEVLVHGWEEWGEDLLAELRGMFAFALLDLRRRHSARPMLFLARDPLGIKPLSYAESDGAVLFASGSVSFST